MPKGIYNRTKAKPPPRRKFHKNRDWLFNEYIVKKRATTDIARDLGVRPPAISYWAKKWDIPLRDSRDASQLKWMNERMREKATKYKITKEYLEENYTGGKKTLNQIAQEFGCSWDVVRKRLNSYGIPLRNNSKHRLNKTKRTTTEGRRFQKKLLRSYGYKCAVCGYDKFVHSCHIIPRHKNGEDTNENGIVLCPNHHYELDYGLISEETIRSYQISKT